MSLRASAATEQVCCGHKRLTWAGRRRCVQGQRQAACCSKVHPGCITQSMLSRLGFQFQRQRSFNRVHFRWDRPDMWVLCSKAGRRRRVQGQQQAACCCKVHPGCTATSISRLYKFSASPAAPCLNQSTYYISSGQLRTDQMPQPATRENKLTAANVSYSIRLVMAQECFFRASQPGTMYGVADADCRNLRMGSAVL